jgi:capsular exopolysaccharide synthesis family protein
MGGRISQRSQTQLGGTIIEDETLDLRKYLGILLANWWLLLLLPTAGALIGYVYSKNQNTLYRAEATILVQYRGNSFVPGASDFRQSSELAATYVRLVTAKPFLQRVQENAVLPDIAGSLGSISATMENTPPAIDIRVKHSEPTMAAAITQIVAEEFIDYTFEKRLAEIARLQAAAAAQGIRNVQDLTAAQFTAIDSLSLLEDVEIPVKPMVPRTRLNVVAGVSIGIVLAIGLALLLEALRDTVRFPDQLKRRFGVDNLGSIFKWSGYQAREANLLVHSAPKSNAAEAFRQIRANIQFATANQRISIMSVSSPGPHEGKTTIISNLAVAFAQAGERVIIVDGDMRRPSIHQSFKSLLKDPGLSNYLADPNSKVSDVVHSTHIDGLSIIPAGPTPPNPAELLGSPKMPQLLAELRNDYDKVFIDGPPALVVSDGSVLAAQMDGVIVVVDGFGTRPSSLQATLETLRNTQVKLLGVITNKMKPPRFNYRYRYPYYYYSS